MTRRLTRVFREHIKGYFGVSDEELTAAEEKAHLTIYPDGEDKFTGGYGLEFWSEVLQKKICLVCSDEYFDDENDDQEDKE